ncbi:MAG TPA: DUF3237 domain-containing protein [Bryobacteraceae bacterium]|jgi:hypothetical protein|nr:DUF3237 domain-containing protein [Bryobacteraceae bacterium]
MLSPQLEFAFEAAVEVAPPLELGVTSVGNRRIIQILGGSFEGPGLKGRILQGGADWQILRTDGAAELDARYTLQTDQGALIYVVNRGLRHGPPEVLRRMAAGETVDPRSYYFRSAAFFETTAADLQWLTKTIIVGVGERQRHKVLIRFWKVL